MEDPIMKVEEDLLLRIVRLHKYINIYIYIFFFFF